MLEVRVKFTPYKNNGRMLVLFYDNKGRMCRYELTDSVLEMAKLIHEFFTSGKTKIQK